jgi:hypothetical protein
MKKYLLPILLISFWSCEEDNNEAQVTPKGNWVPSDWCDYSNSTCTGDCVSDWESEEEDFENISLAINEDLTGSMWLDGGTFNVSLSKIKEKEYSIEVVNPPSGLLSPGEVWWPLVLSDDGLILEFNLNVVDVCYDSDGYSLITATDSSDCESQDGHWQIGHCGKITFTKN